MSTRRTAGVVAGLLLLAPLASMAAEETKSAPPAQPEATAAAQPQTDAALDALKVGKDPKTGELRKTTAAEDAELARQLRAFWAQYPRHSAKTDRRTGTTSLVVAPHSISTSIATIGPDGRPALTCIASSVDAGAVLAQMREKAARQQPEPGDR